MVLNKRIMRDFKENSLRNISMILIIALSMALVVALCSTSDSISKTIHMQWDKCFVEDGSFETYVPLSKRNLNELSELNAAVEPMFYFDAPLENAQILRVFSNRKAIDLPFVQEGSLPKTNEEIFLEKKFAAQNGLRVGDYITVGGKSFKISAVGCLPDYGYVKQNVNDVSATEGFSVAVVSSNAWKSIKGTNKTVYNYAYRLGSGCSADDLKNKLTHLKYDKSAVGDTYIKSRQQKAKLLGDSFEAATNGLKSGALALAEGAEKLENTLKEINSEFKTGDLSGGAAALYGGLDELQNTFGESLGSSETALAVNLSALREAKYNIRITDALDDSQIGKQSALAVGAILFILLVYMLSIFASGAIERERAVIGTLYALGYSRGEILSHYMKIPMLVAFSGAVIGTAAGFLLTDNMAASYEALYSFPNLKHVYSPYLLAYALGLPTVFSYLINRAVLGKKLKKTPLKMMRGEKTARKSFNPNLERLSFGAKFRVRQFLRELSGNITLFGGVFVSILLIMFSLACYTSIKGYINGITNDVGYNYMYILKNPVSDLPKNPCVGYTRGFYVDFPMTGGEIEVSLLGLGDDNPYFDFANSLGEDADKIYISSSAKTKFGYKKGDKVVFRDSAENRFYAFEIADEVTYGNGLYFFMNLDAMRKAFGNAYFDKDDLKKGERVPKPESYYYNTVFSDKKLEFKHNMALSEISKADMKAGAEKFIVLMWDMIVMMIAVSVIIFAVTMYLLMKLEIDRSSFSVSLLKALGYREKTVNSFYIGSSFYVTAAAMIIGAPICKEIVKIAYPFCVSNVNAGFEVIVGPLQYAILAAIVFSAYFIVRFMLVRYLKKIEISEMLKNRE